MTDDRSLERAARSWLEEGPTAAPDRPVEAALALIQTTPQERDLRIPRRFAQMSTLARVAAAAVLGVLAIGGATSLLGRPSASVGSLSPTPGVTPSAPPSPSATALTLPARGPLAAGRYVIRMPDAPVDVEFTVGDGWESGGYYINTDRHSISFWTVDKVFTDACDTATAPDGALGRTVDDLVRALDAQANTDMSRPVPIVVDGHPGVRVELSPSSERPEFCEVLSLWTIQGGIGRGIDTNSGAPGELVQPVWILDVDGERVVFVGWDSMLGQADPRKIADVIESMTLTRR